MEQHPPGVTSLTARRIIPLMWVRIASIAAVALLAFASQAEEETDEDGLRCINSRSIRSTDVINDSNIIFEMQGKKLYQNTLPRSCRGLSREERFSYTTHTRSLCANDLITVLNDSGMGMIEGRACKLGRFRPTTEEEVGEFVQRLYAPPEARMPEPPPPREVVSEDEPPEEHEQ